MTAGEIALTTCASIGLGLGALCAVIGKANQIDYELWQEEFEKELGYPVPEEDKSLVLPHLYDDYWSVPSAVRKYKEIIKESDIHI